MLSKFVGAFVGLMVLGDSLSLIALSQPNAPVREASPQPMLTQSSSQRSLPILIARRVQQDLARRLNVPVNTLELKEAVEKTWPDQCLGIRHSTTEDCGIHDVKGWQITMGSAQQTWVYRSDRIARRLRLEPLAQATESATAHFSTQTSQKLLATVSEQLQQPIDELSILAVRAIERDICLKSDVPTVGENCQTEVAPGFQVIVAEGTREWPMVVVEEYGGEIVPGNMVLPLVEEGPKEWVYEIDEDGERIVQNAIASDSIGKVATYFASAYRSGTLPDSPAGEPEIIFQMVYYFSDRDIMTLMADGTVYFERESYRPEDTIERYSTYAISSEQVAAFEALLKQQQFAKFDRLVYGNEDLMLATEGIVTLISKDASVSFNATGEYLPSNLQSIVKPWATGRFPSGD